MTPSNQKTNIVCRETQTQLSDYLDNSLSAREVWEVEKHLAACADCTEFSQSLQQTVNLLHSAESLDTSGDFMARLHARLDGLEPEPMRRPAPLSALRDWLAGVRDSLYVRRVPALSLGMASLAMALILMVSHQTLPVDPLESGSVAAARNLQLGQDQDALSKHVAVTASNPFDDPVAAKLEAEASNDKPSVN